MAVNFRVHISRALAALLAVTSLPGALLAAPLTVRAGEVIIKVPSGARVAAASSIAGGRVISLDGKTARVSFGSGASTEATANEELYNPTVYDSLCKTLKATGVAERCSPNFVIHSTLVPDDSYYSELYGMTLTDTQTAWDTTTGSSAVTVAVVDTGIDYNHPDLSPNIWVNPDEVPDNGVDDDGDGYIDDVHGANMITGSGDPMDDNEHGTHVSGTIGAVGNNGSGVVGMCWNVQIMGVKFIGSNGSGDLYDAVRGIQYAIDHGAKIINASWGGGGYSEVLEAVIQDAGKAGILFVAAAGNESNDNDRHPTYPSSYDARNIISVAAVNSAGNFVTSFSNYGVRAVDVGAPGYNILSTVTDSTYAYLSGTSMATPHVVGLAALLSAVQPGLSAIQLKQIIMDTVTHKSSLLIKTASGGYINAANAVAEAVVTTPSGDESNGTYTLSIEPYNSSNRKYSSSGKITDRYRFKIEYSGVMVQETMKLSVNLGGKYCTVGKVSIDPSKTSVTLPARAYPRFRGRFQAKLIDSFGLSIAGAQGSYSPRTAPRVNTISAKALCTYVKRSIGS